MVIEAPLIAKKHRAGQFVIVINSEKGERIPLTIADKNVDKGEIVLIFQEVGMSTMEMGKKKAGEYLFDVVGPLGQPTHIEKFGTVVVIGGGVGTAPAHPITQELKKCGNRIITILGARNKDLFIMEEEMTAVSDEIYFTTDDGSKGRHGLVTDELQSLIDKGTEIDLVLAIGPAIMMKFVSLLTKKYNLKTVVSLNSIMVDGTGMCGACRVTIGDKTKFVCVDGPEFDGHLVNFDELMQRQRMYLTEEKVAVEKFLKEEKKHHKGGCCGGHHE
jgi:ferredoxin--NADP+ reductase